MLFRSHPKRKKAALEQYDGMSWAGPKKRWCTGILKDRVISRYLSEIKKQYEIVEYIGIAADEPKRIRGKIYPLVEWGMTEADCLAYCYERGFDWGGLYEIFKRVSCWCCPLQSLDALRKLWEHFPKLWEKLLAWDNATWKQYRADYSVKDLTIRFDMETEWIKAGRNIRCKDFYSALKERLKKGAENA